MQFETMNNECSYYSGKLHKLKKHACKLITGFFIQLPFENSWNNVLSVNKLILFSIWESQNSKSISAIPKLLLI